MTSRWLCGGMNMTSRKINVGIIGTGWIGEIRAKVCANSPLVESLHIAEIDPAKLARVGEQTRAKTATTDYRELLQRDDIDAIFVCSTPETTHYPITKDCLLARKHALLEKPMGLALQEADEMMTLAKKESLKFTIGYTQRFNPKYAYVKQSLLNGTLGRPVTYPHCATATLEFGGTEGALLVDDSHRDIVLNTMKGGMPLPLSTMPGEQVAHVYQGPMEAETIHVVEAVALDRAVLVTPGQARQVMEITLAADLSAECHQPVSLPLQT